MRFGRNLSLWSDETQRSWDSSFERWKGIAGRYDLTLKIVKLRRTAACLVNFYD